MAWVEVVKWNSFDAVGEAVQRLRERFAPRPELAPVRAIVPACRCAGQCHCGTVVPYLLQRQLEMECEFYREVH
jgi:hypothetical protein